jgi:septal ring factor EnvC (AmiA/AmiB activator)
MNRTSQNSNGFTITTLGNIKWNPENEQLNESTVELSEKNFRTLIALIPTTSTRQYLYNAIQSMKDKLNQLQYSNNNNEAKLSDYLELLQDELNWQKFQDDVVEFGKLPMIIGHVELP